MAHDCALYEADGGCSYDENEPLLRRPAPSACVGSARARATRGDVLLLLFFSSEPLSDAASEEDLVSLAGVTMGIVLVGGPHGGSAASSYDSST